MLFRKTILWRMTLYLRVWWNAAWAVWTWFIPLLLFFVRNLCILDSHSEIAVPQAGISWYRPYEHMPSVILRDSLVQGSTKLFRDSPDGIHVHLCAIRASLLRPTSFPRPIAALLNGPSVSRRPKTA
ncbi:uncharacterized protein ACHE_70373A [Aspergillus chevalieri]|uniref:Uncharacterized protein n=1 Tax=Aspergillus chevalieri TaxID=182096 RepID=A0A7R7VVH1_ASPCH|nr:uncharacterized protein ACHE_70373A [Aspergillus chevalieri]BCR91530.1 hypothetical protein ACHE_70373A [Aspergillus chevalieri]